MKIFQRTLLSVAIISVAGGALASDDLFGSTDSDDLFGGGDAFITDSVDNSSDLADELLINENGIVWSGSYQWESAAAKTDHEMVSDDIQLDSAFSGNLKLDARPDADYRALINLDYEVSESAANINIREGFADFSVGDKAFVRAGQQTLSWGVGYFYSPADSLNADSINAADPDADRIGTAAVRVHVPVNTANYYAYVLPDDQQNDVTIAAKAEWLVAGNELGIGAVYHANDELNLVGTASMPTALGDFFAEYTASLGETTLAVAGNGVVSDRTDVWLHQATIGYTAVEDIGDITSAQISAQYFYNGLGYNHTLRTDNPMQWSQLSSANALSGFAGQNYGAAMLNLSDLFGSDVSLTALILTDLDDNSFMLMPTITWTPLDTVSVETGMTSLKGDLGSTYATMGDLSQTYVKLTLAKGSF